MMEIWKDVLNYEGAYKVSSLGNVKSLDRTVKSAIKHNNTVLRKGKVLIPGNDKDGYKLVGLCLDGKHISRRVHILVAESFIANENNYPHVNHKNGVKWDNRAENLEWVTPSMNRKHAYDIGLQSAKGEKNGQAKLTDKQVGEIREIYSNGFVKQDYLASLFGVSRSHISTIVNHKGRI